MRVVDWIFPKRCVGCKREGEFICLECQKKLLKPKSICPMCTGASEGGWTHIQCRKKEGIERLLVGLSYKGVVQKCLKKVKYQSQWDRLADLYRLCEFPGLSGVVTSVPMWKTKEKERGFNQAELLAKLLAKQHKIPFLVMLERGRETKPMFGLNKQDRRENVKGAFRINPKLEIRNSKHVVLVDDVWTTGATMRECARALKNGGVKEVWGVTIAR